MSLECLAGRMLSHEGMPAALPGRAKSSEPLLAACGGTVTCMLKEGAHHCSDVGRHEMADGEAQHEDQQEDQDGDEDCGGLGAARALWH